MIVKKKNVIASLAIFLFIFIAFFFSSSITLFVEGGARPQGIENAEVLNDFFINKIYLIVFVCIFGIVSLIQRKIYILGFLKSDLFKVFILFFWITFFQLLFGVDYRQDMISYLIIIGIMFYSCWLIFNVVTPEQIFRSLNFFYFLMFMFSFFLIFLVPSYGISFGEDVWQGAFNHKNNLGLFCASYGLVAIISFKVQPKLTLLNLLIAVILCFGASSYTSLSCLIFIFLFILIYKFLSKFFSIASLMIILISLLTSGMLVYFSVSGVNLPILDKDFTFSGRNEIWLYSILKISQSPIIGYGYGALGYQNNINSAAFFNATGQVLGSNHNGFIGLLYNYGFPGFLIFIFFLVRYYRKSIVVKLNAKYSFFVAGFILLNTFEDRIFGIYITLFVLAVWFSYIDYYLSKGNR